MDPEGNYKRFEDEAGNPPDIQPPLYSIDPNVYQQDHNYTLGYADTNIPEAPHTTLYAPHTTPPSTFNAFMTSPSVTVDIPVEQFNTYQQGGTYEQGTPSPYSPPEKDLAQLTAEKIKSHRENIQEAILARDYQVTIGPWFSKSWEIFKQCWWGYMLTYLMLIILCALPIAQYFAIVLTLPILCGIFIATSNSIKNGTAPRFGHMLHGILFTVPLLILQILCSIAIGLGYLFCIVPGIFLSVVLAFAPYVYVEFYCSGVSVLDAIVLSFKMVSRKFFSVLLFLLVALLLNILGVILVGIGLLVTGPLTIIAMAVATQEIFGLNITKQLDSECIIGM